MDDSIAILRQMQESHAKHAEEAEAIGSNEAAWHRNRCRALTAAIDALTHPQDASAGWNAVGGDLPLDREEAGIVFDALMEHADSATKRKGVNPASNSDVRTEICHRVMDRIRSLCAALPSPPNALHQPAKGGAL